MRERSDVHVDPNRRGRRATDERIARVASRQAGTIARWQLLRLGLTAREIELRVKTGRLRMAALSHRGAAALHKLVPSKPPCIDLTVTGRRAPRNRQDLRFRRATTPETTTRHGLPVTTAARTLQDLAATRPEAEVRKALNQALVQRLIRTDQLVDRSGPGAAVLKRLARTAAPTRSILERRFLKALRDFTLPEPVKEHPLGRYQADFHWPGHGLVVQTDGWHTHGGPIAFVDDRIRDAEHAIRGLVVIRVTDEQVDHDLPATTDRLRRWFAGPGARRAGSRP
jgi:very-short-patch-repair endonuclease